jgi:hypothetical protein
MNGKGCEMIMEKCEALSWHFLGAAGEVLEKHWLE